MKHKILKYTVIYEPAEEGGYVVRIPTLGAATQGETIEEAQLMARECIEANIIGLQELGEEIPVEPENVLTATTAVTLQFA